MRRARRVIDELRRLFPGEWVYDRSGFTWNGPDFYVWAEGNLCNRYEGDESTYTTFRRSDTYALLPLPGSPFYFPSAPRRTTGEQK